VTVLVLLLEALLVHVGVRVDLVAVAMLVLVLGVLVVVRGVGVLVRDVSVLVLVRVAVRGVVRVLVVAHGTSRIDGARLRARVRPGD
jgi:hypothetical protein